jgi:hypothetical protein
MAGEKDEFKFPDEVEDKSSGNQSADTDIEIEIVDDTPPQDRGRKPLDREVADPTEDEIESYSDKVKSRIKELTHARHDERRKAEALARERQELERLAQQLIDENKSLKQRYNAGQEVYATTAKEKAESDLDIARRELKQAHEAFDTDAIVAAQEKLAEAKMRSEAAKNFKPTPLQEAEYELKTQQPSEQSVKPDEKSLRWQAKNQWFGQDGFEEYTSYALGLHQKLVSGGIDPRSDDYYDQINGRMKSKFPELFGETEDKPKSGEVQKKPTTVVAPAARSASAGKIRLTATQVALAKKFNLTPQQYAAQVAKLENQNG